MINVNLDRRSYQIIVKDGALDSLVEHLENNGEKWILISQDSIMRYHGNKLYDHLLNQGFNISKISIQDGETSKSLEVYTEIISKMLKDNFDRSSIILSLGGGVVGDIAGFISATYLRGIKYYQIPTTLLAMVDSSIGGKTGLNFSNTKNIIGSIYQPAGVIVDPQLLRTLPKEEVISGLGEIIKYGAIRDRDFLLKLSEWFDNLDSFPFMEAIKHCCRIKASIVSKDEREGDLRRILNFGHTVGHALESYIGYDLIKHGEAVSYGMKCSSWISKEMGLLEYNDYTIINDIISKLPLPKIKDLNIEKIIEYIASDKKYDKGVLNFVLLKGLGNAIISKDVSRELIYESIKVLE